MTAATAAARRAAARTPARGRSQAGLRRPRTTAGTTRRRAPRPAREALTPLPARLVPLAVGRTASAVSDIAESGLVHRLTRGRLWIGALTTLLVGIVGMNVVALSFNAQASKSGREADGLERQISMLRARIAAAGVSNERAQSLAAKLGLIVPDPESIRYLTPGHRDAATAAQRLISGELVAGSLSSAPSTDTSAATSPVEASPAPAMAPAAVPAPAPAQDPVPAPMPPPTGAGTTGTESSAPGGGATGGATTGGGTPTGGGVSTP
jgi:hypothetical protein